MGLSLEFHKGDRACRYLEPVLVTFCCCEETPWQETYKRKFVGTHSSRGLESLIFMVGSLTADRQARYWSNSWELTASWSTGTRQKERVSAKWKCHGLWKLQSLPPVICLLHWSHTFHQLGTKYSNVQAYGNYSYSNHHRLSKCFFRKMSSCRQTLC